MDKLPPLYPRIRVEIEFNKRGLELGPNEIPEGMKKYYSFLKVLFEENARGYGSCKLEDTTEGLADTLVIKGIAKDKKSLRDLVAGVYFPPKRVHGDFGVKYAPKVRIDWGC